MMFNEIDNGIGGIGFLPGGSAVAASAGGGPVGMIIGAGISLVSVIGRIFGAHKARVKRENEVTGVWAATGQKAIDETMAYYRSGRASDREALSALDDIERQYEELMREVSKYKGKFGSFPDVNGPRPLKDCNAACGIRWDLHQQLNGLRQEIKRGGNKQVLGFGQSIGGVSESTPLLPLLLIIGLALAVS